jgi:hypothetical protein
LTHFVEFKSVVETNTILGKRFELAQMEAASCSGGVRRYRYSGQLERAPKKSELRKLILQSFLYFCSPNKGKK